MHYAKYCIPDSIAEWNKLNNDIKEPESLSRVRLGTKFIYRLGFRKIDYIIMNLGGNISIFLG